MATEIGDYDLKDIVEVGKAFREKIDDARRAATFHAILNGTPVPSPLQTPEESVRHLNPEIVGILIEAYKNRYKAKV